MPGLGVIWRVEQPTEPAAPSSAAPSDFSPSVSTIVPADGCADFVLRGDALLIAGPSTQWLRSPVDSATPTVGIRFAPGTAAAAFGRPLDALRDSLVPADVAIAGAVALRVASSMRALASGTRQDATELMREREFVPSLAHAIDADGGVSTAPVPWRRAALQAADAEDSLSALAHRIGFSERQVHRRMLAEFGYGFAALRRVRRGLRARLALDNGASLAQVAVRAGYADQSHFTREFSRMMGETPLQYARLRQVVAPSDAGAAGSGA